MKAPDFKFVLALKTQAPALPQEICKIEHSEMPFLPFLSQGWSSLKFSLKSKILNENGQ